MCLIFFIKLDSFKIDLRKSPCYILINKVDTEIYLQDFPKKKSVYGFPHLALATLKANGMCIKATIFAQTKVLAIFNITAYHTIN